MKRRPVMVIVNGLLCYGANYGATAGYRLFRDNWQDYLPSQTAAAILATAFITIISVIFAAWGVAFYSAMRKQLDNQQHRAATVFE